MERLGFLRRFHPRESPLIISTDDPRRFLLPKDHEAVKGAAQPNKESFNRYAQSPIPAAILENV